VVCFEKNAQALTHQSNQAKEEIMTEDEQAKFLREVTVGVWDTELRNVEEVLKNTKDEKEIAYFEKYKRELQAKVFEASILEE
jgi:hypothetical protein